MTGEHTDGQRDGRTDSGPSRRTFLKAATAGAVASTGLGLTGVGSAQTSTGIPTPPLHRDGNLIRDPDGNKVILRGVNTADPRRLDVTAPARGKNAEQVVDFATSEEAGWYSRVIRFPVQPVDIGKHEPGHGPEPVAFDEDQLQTYLEDHLDPVIDRCEERGVYAIVDFHRHRNISWDNPDLSEEVQMFWDVVAPRYSDRDHVLYEVYNEPLDPHITVDPAEREYEAGIWRDWVDTAQPWVDTVRSHADNLVLMGSPTWSQTPEGARVEEFEGGDIAYTYHIYPGHSISDENNWAENNEEGQGTSRIYEEVPLFVTEFGWQQGISAYPVIGSTDDFGKPFMEWLNSAPIHWTAWCFDTVWLSAMVQEDFETPGFEDNVGNPYEEDVPVLCEDLPCDWVARGGQDMGVLIKEQLAELADQDVPGTDGDGNGNGGDGDVEAIDGTVPQDVDGDGLYEDLNGNGETDYSDVVRYFNNMDQPAMTNHTAAYDYNGNGDIDYADLVDLFGRVQ